MKKPTGKEKTAPISKPRKTVGASASSKAPASARPSEGGVTSGEPVKAASRAERSAKFRCYEPNARNVFVAGSFNGWDPVQTRLNRGDDGTWSLDLNLPPGTYEYRFVVDGAWTEDPNAGRQVENPFGTRNSVMVVALDG